jgi:hypothetical protein
VTPSPGGQRVRRTSRARCPALLIRIELDGEPFTSVKAVSQDKARDLAHSEDMEVRNAVVNELWMLAWVDKGVAEWVPTELYVVLQAVPVYGSTEDVIIAMIRGARVPHPTPIFCFDAQRSAPYSLRDLDIEARPGYGMA